MTHCRRHPSNLLYAVLAIVLIAVTNSYKVHFVTYLSSVKTQFSCTSLCSAILRGIDLQVLGYHETQSIENSSPTRIPSLLLKHLKESTAESFEDDDIIVYNDGSTVLYRGSSSDVEMAYLKVEHENTVLFSGERDCWPGTGGCAEPNSCVQSSFKFPRTTGFIARHKTIVKLLAAWVKVIESKPFRSDNDQLALHQYMMTKGDLNTNVRIEVDSNCSIFQTSTGTHLASEKWSIPDSRGPYMRINDGIIFNSETNTEPLLYHFNHESVHMIDADLLMWASNFSRLNSSADFTNNCAELIRKFLSIDSCSTDPSFIQSLRLTCADTRIRSSNIANEGISRRAIASEASDWLLFPDYIAPFHVRADTSTGIAVTRGRVTLLKGTKRHTLTDYNRLLQCPPGQPELFGKGGALSLAKYIPLTQETILLVSAHIESECGLWNGCRPVVLKFLNSGYPKNFHEVYKLSGQTSAKLFRVINGSLYYDWPWGRGRFDHSVSEDESTNYKIPIMDVLLKVFDFHDSVFFVGGELSGLPSNIPVPFLSSSPKGSSSSDIPGLWSAAFNFERSRYRRGNYETVTREHDKKILSNTPSDSNNPKDELQYNSSVSWSSRIDKAAFFGCMSDSGLHSHSMARQVVMNVATEYPEHLDASFHLCFQITDINPASKEVTNCFLNETEWTQFHSKNSSTAPFGFADRSFKRHNSERIELNKYMLSYRYLVVIAGIASADRLNTFLAHSGAVILLQETDFLYHYSAFLQPWVHYVPLAFNAADLLEKIEWLKAHPRHARRLAINAQNFGASYLRLEDYYCYTAAFLQAVGDIAAPSALLPFDMAPTPMTN